MRTDHWEARGRALIVEEEGGGKEAEGGGEKGAVTKVDELLEGCLKALQELEQRLDVAVRSETTKRRWERREGRRKRTVVVQERE